MKPGPNRKKKQFLNFLYNAPGFEIKDKTEAAKRISNCKNEARLYIVCN